MESYVDFVSRLIYATGVEAVITPNHEDWVAANPSPSGLDWNAHFLGSLLPAYENWLATNNLPPIVAWNGADTNPWDAGDEQPVTPPLDNPMAIASLTLLGEAFRDRFNISAADELGGDTKAPFSYRFWGYLKYFNDILRQYSGEIVIPASTVYDRDGTILSPLPFCNTYNTLHANWHGSNASTGQNTQATPGFESSAGQTTSTGGIGMGNGEEFIKFHHDHTELFSRWLARTGQLPVKPINLYNGGSGWPSPSAGNPSTWVEDLHDLWINDKNGDTDDQMLDILGSVEDIGDAMNSFTPTLDRNGAAIVPALGFTAIHGSGHGANSDIGSLRHNNFTSRFHAWHGWIDTQWYWRKPRFGYYDNTEKQRVKVFEPVDFSTGANWPGMSALTIVRDTTLPNDFVSPANSLSGLSLSTGAGTLKMKFSVEDPYNRRLTMRLSADVFNDSASTVTESILDSVHTYTVGSTASGDDFDLNTDFTIDFNFSTAFLSDDPTRGNAEVGFISNRIRINGSLTVTDGSDPGFVETDFIDIDLIQEKEAPEIELYLDMSSFGEDQVIAAQSLSTATEGLFENAFYVILQDQTTDANPIDWSANPDVSPSVHGLIEGFTPASGLFDDPAHAPEVVLWDTVAGTAVPDVRIELNTGPLLEDSSLAANLPQRYTYSYNIIFESGNGGFSPLAIGAQRFVELRVNAYDRSGNQSDDTAQIKLFKDANPYMTDGSKSWLSIDTRTFHILEGDTLFGETVSSTTDPNTLVQTFITKLNTGVGLGTDTFDDLPTNQADSSLLPFDTITDQTTGITKNVHNFALAKVRLQGNAGATDVRAFFRLFRYSSSNLIFDSTDHYRTHDAGGGLKVPLLGYSGSLATDELISIPFFASPRVTTSTSMTTQTDAPNVQNFPSGIATEQFLYFGVYLDINQSSVRFPSNYIPAHPDGGFTGADPTQSLSTLMLDHHQCMVVEVNYDGDPTTIGDTPSGSDNLAQRNLMILTTDNPGAPITHSVEHSFEMNLGRKNFHRPNAHSKTEFAFKSPILKELRYISKGTFDQRVKEEAMNLAMNSSEATMMEWKKFVADAEGVVRKSNPLVFDHQNWAATTDWADELMIRWNDIPKESKATIYLPTMNCEQVVNLRNLRHAPNDVKIVDSHTLLLNTEDVTYLPIPALRRDEITGVISIELPEGIKKGQNWKVDVIQIRGGKQQVVGGFQIDIQVKIAKEIYQDETRFLKHVFDQASLMEPSNRWYSVLNRRVDTLRKRAKALAESAGAEWKDPTSYLCPKDKVLKPFEGQKLRVVLEKIQILDDLDTFVKGKGEFVFQTQVHSSNNGGQHQKVRLPEKGIMKISDKAGRNIVEINRPIFEGYVSDDLRIEIVGTEKDLLDPNDTLGKYSRIFCKSVQGMYGVYYPNDQETIDPEDLVSWKVWYRIERA